LKGADAASAAEIDREVDTAVQTLYNSVPAAPTLVAQARGILIFPKIVKGGFLVGGEYGEGPCDWAARPVATTTSPPSRMACKPACKSLATRWSS
jgi:lipid-binding SYLF domain-containing protein